MRRLLVLLVLLGALGAGGTSTPAAQASACDWDGAAYISECTYFHGCNFKTTRPYWHTVGWLFRITNQIVSCNSTVEAVGTSSALNSGPGPSPLDGPWFEWPNNIGGDPYMNRDSLPGGYPALPPANGSSPAVNDNIVQCQWHGARWISSRNWINVTSTAGYTYSTQVYSPIGEVYGMVGCA